MIKYTMETRKPTIVWNVAFEDKIGKVFKNMGKDCPRSKRWCLLDLTEFAGREASAKELADKAEEIKYFKSRRAAFHFFETGEKFKTKPVYAGLRGGGSKRIR